MPLRRFQFARFLAHVLWPLWQYECPVSFVPTSCVGLAESSEMPQSLFLMRSHSQSAAASGTRALIRDSQTNSFRFTPTASCCARLEANEKACDPEPCNPESLFNLSTVASKRRYHTQNWHFSLHANKTRPNANSYVHKHGKAVC